MSLLLSLPINIGKLENSNSFHQVDILFKEMKMNKKTFSCYIDQIDLYKKALDLVNKKCDLYSDMLKHVTCPENEIVLKKILSEENHQKFVLENILEMVTRPDNWIENAEFYKVEEY